MAVFLFKTHENSFEIFHLFNHIVPINLTRQKFEYDTLILVLLLSPQKIFGNRSENIFNIYKINVVDRILCVKVSTVFVSDGCCVCVCLRLRCKSVNESVNINYRANIGGESSKFFLSTPINYNKRRRNQQNGE